MCYKVKIFEDINEIDKNEWMNLELLDSESTIFQSYTWTKNYCDFLLKEKRALFILFYKENEVVAIFPMQIRLFRKVLLYEFMGGCGVDCLMPLIMDVHKGNVYLEFIAWIEKQSNNTIFVSENIPHSHSFLQYLESGVTPTIAFSNYKVCTYFILWLPKTWEEYKCGLSKRMRHDIDYDRRYISRKIPIEFGEVDVNRIDEHILLNKGRMHTRDLISPFDFESACLFWKAYFKDEFLKSRLRFYAITSKTEIISSAIAVDDKGKRYILSLSINIKYEKYSPGNVLLGYLVEDSINQKIKALDFGRGQDQYKLRLGAKEYLNDRSIICVNKEKQKKYSGYVSYLYNKLGYYLTDA